MAPSAIYEAVQANPVADLKAKKLNGSSTAASSYTPLKQSGVLNQFESFQNTPCIGTEFRNVNLKEWITGPDSDAILRDLAITIAERGVVFFRAQDEMDGELQKELTDRLGALSNRPADHGLYKHIMHQIRGDDPQMGKLDPATQAKNLRGPASGLKQSCATEWHTDTSFEPCPPDFTMLRMTELPRTGGDTLWASSYELYDRLSAPFQKLWEGLTTRHVAVQLQKAAQQYDVYKGPRGSPDNVPLDFDFDHPAVRTHPVTGWKALYVCPLFSVKVNDVSEDESVELLKKIQWLVATNHDLQVRFHWDNPNDIAIWDNRSVLHAATQDCYGHGPRMGWRTMSIGERPFLDPQSPSRKQALSQVA